MRFTARVTPTAAAGGTVQFTVDGVAVGGPVVVNAIGRATLVTAFAAVGTHTVSAAYGGTVSYLPSMSTTFTQVVNAAASRTVVTSSGSPAVLGTTVVLTATVTPVVPGAGLASGTIQFRVDGVDVGTPAALNPSGQAAFATATLARGRHTVTAVYSGDAGFTGSTSRGLTQRIQ